MRDGMIAVDRVTERGRMERVMKNPVEKRGRLNEYIAPDSHTRQELTGLCVAMGDATSVCMKHRHALLHLLLSAAHRMKTRVHNITEKTWPKD